LLNPVATITYALTLLTGSRKTIIVHPGTYTENVTVANTNTTIATTELTGANTLLSGTLTIGSLGSGSRISGLKMTNLVISGTAQAYISNCTVDTQVTKSSSGYVEIINSEMQCTLGIQISGSNITIINGNKNDGVSVSNASAQVIVKGCNSVVTPSASAGNLAIVDCIVTALGGNGVTITGASTTLTLINSQVLVSAGNNVAPISVAGIYSIINTIYDKPTSSLTGTSTNSIDYFQFINADKFIKQGGTASQYLMADGSVSTSVGGVTSVAALTIGTSGSDLASSVANGTTTPVITLNVPTASAANRGALSSADWSTFNGKQNTIGLTTVGTNLATLPNPNAITFLRVNADNSVTARTPAQVITDLGISSNIIVNRSFADTSAVTGTIATTLIFSVLIPANTFITNDWITTRLNAKTTGTGGADFRIYLNTSAAIGGTIIGAWSAALNTASMFERNYMITATGASGSIKYAGFAGASPYTPQNVSWTSLTFNTTIDQYLVFAIQNNNVAASSTTHGNLITITR
jgi:hypothetical protein